MSYVNKLEFNSRRHPTKPITREELNEITLQLGLAIPGENISDREKLDRLNEHVDEENRRIAKLTGEVEHIISTVKEELAECYKRIGELETENKRLMKERDDALRLITPKIKSKKQKGRKASEYGEN